MSIGSVLNRSLKIALLGRHSVPQTVDLGFESPQTEVAVWLHGVGEPRDVTALHAVACPIPATVCIGFPDQTPAPSAAHARPELHFVRRGSSERLLGSIQLRQQSIIRTSGPELRLYRATACTNHCISPLRNRTHALHVMLSQYQRRGEGVLKLSALDGLCNEVVFNCPRPVALLSLGLVDGWNIVPVNLMGLVGEDHFAFALNHNNRTASSVTAGACLALSTIPFTHAHHVRQLGSNHHRRSIASEDLPWSTYPSPTLGVPVPEFALTVTELRLEQHIPLGSHTLCIARILARRTLGAGAEFHRIHGGYAALRLQAQRDASL